MIFDGHSDILTDLTIRYAKGDEDPFIKVHMDGLRQGGVGGAIFVIWPEPPHCETPYERSREILRTLDRELVKGHFRLVKSYDEFRTSWQKEFTVFLGAEGLSSIEHHPEFLDELYEKGLRIGSLTWNESNGLATGVSGDPARGLTQFGADTVRRLESMGILLDVSHLNERSFWDVAKITSKPIIASHSNLMRLSRTPRNLTDDQVKLIAQTGGLIGMNAYKDFVSKNPSDQNVEGLGEHIIETINLVGIDHVALGFDFFNYLENETTGSFAEENPNLDGMEDASKAFKLVDHMKHFGFTQSEIEKVCFKNYMRVIKAVIG